MGTNLLVMDFVKRNDNICRPDALHFLFRQDSLNNNASDGYTRLLQCHEKKEEEKLPHITESNINGHFTLNSNQWKSLKFSENSLNFSSSRITGNGAILTVSQ